MRKAWLMCCESMPSVWHPGHFEETLGTQPRIGSFYYAVPAHAPDFYCLHEFVSGRPVSYHHNFAVSYAKLLDHFGFIHEMEMDWHTYLLQEQQEWEEANLCRQTINQTNRSVPVAGGMATRRATRKQAAKEV